MALHQLVHIVVADGGGGAPTHDVGIDEVGAHFGKFLVDHGLHAVTEADDDDDRRHADDDAKHGQKGTHLAGGQGLERQEKGLAYIHSTASSGPPNRPPSAPSPSSSSAGCTSARGSWESPS
ncbi:hypothetical protein SDC9_112493 [bioreactor metagenome]|uniref:Uncharacterized protein n=1 Tax=bioreactor metagenome TaxID=1076179 RepID=A0A645BK38_9ZZZZ